MATDTEVLLARLLAEKAPTSRRTFLSRAFSTVLVVGAIAGGLWYADVTIEPVETVIQPTAAPIVLPTSVPRQPVIAQPVQPQVIVAPAAPVAQQELAVEPTAIPIIAEPVVVAVEPTLAPSLGRVSNDQPAVVSDEKGGQMGLPKLNRREWNGHGSSDAKGGQVGLPSGDGQ